MEKKTENTSQENPANIEKNSGKSETRPKFPEAACVLLLLLFIGFGGFLIQRLSTTYLSPLNRSSSEIHVNVPESKENAHDFSASTREKGKEEERLHKDHYWEPGRPRRIRDGYEQYFDEQFGWLDDPESFQEEILLMKTLPPWKPEDDLPKADRNSHINHAFVGPMEMKEPERNNRRDRRRRHVEGNLTTLKEKDISWVITETII